MLGGRVEGTLTAKNSLLEVKSFLPFSATRPVLVLLTACLCEPPCPCTAVCRWFLATSSNNSILLFRLYWKVVNGKCDVLLAISHRCCSFSPPLISRLQQQHPCFGAVCRLAKRWLGAQLLSDDVTEDAADLLVASLFLHPAPFTPPGYWRPLSLKSCFCARLPKIKKETKNKTWLCSFSRSCE